MPVNCRFVIQEQLFIRAVRHGHDVDVVKFRAGFAPVAMRQDVVTAHLASRFYFATGRHCPVKQRVEARDAHAAR